MLNPDKIESSFFDINCSRDTVLIGEKGTKITLHENTFVNKKGDFVTGTIQLELKECITKIDIVLANMQTMLGNYGWADNFVGNAYLEAEPIKGLKFRSTMGAKLAYYGGESFTPVFFFN